MNRLLAIVLLSIVVAGCGGRPVAVPAEPPGRRPIGIAVLPFTDVSGSGVGLHPWLGPLAQDALTWELHRRRDVRPVALPDATGIADVDFVVTSTYRPSGDGVEITMTMLDAAASNAVRLRTVVKAALDEIPGAMATTSAALLTALGRETTPMGAVPRVARLPMAHLEPLGHGVGSLADTTRAGGTTALTRAREALERAVAAAPRAPYARYRLAQTLLRAGQYRAAIDHLRHALDNARADGDDVLTTEILVHLGQAYLQLGQAGDAEPLAREALAIARRIGDWRGAAEAHRGLATVHHHRGRHPDALRELNAALAIWETAGDARGEAPVLVHRSTLHLIAGDRDATRRDLLRARELVARTGDRQTARAVENDLGYLDFRLGEYREAQAAFTRALELARAIGDARASAMATKNLGLVASARGALGDAERLLEEARGSLHAMGLRLIELETLEELGSVRFQQRRYDAAAGSYRAALALARAPRVPLSESKLLFHLGRVALAQAQLDDALAHETAALDIARAIRAPRTEALALLGLGDVLLAGGQTDRAAARFAEAIALADRLRVPEVRWRARYGLGVIAERAGRDDAAAARYREALRALEELSVQFDEAERRTFLVDKSAVYDGLARVLFRLHDRRSEAPLAEEAWAVLAAKKGRLVAEELAGVRATPTNPRVRGDVERLDAERAGIDTLERRLSAGDAQDPEAVVRLTQQLASDKRAFLDRVEKFLADHPQYGTRYLDQQRVDVRKLASFSGSIPEGTLAVQYYAAPNALYLFLVRRGGHEIRSVPVSDTRLNELVAEYRYLVTRGGERLLPWRDEGAPEYAGYVAPLKDVTRELSTYLLGPIRRELATYRNLVVMPNDLLFYLPFHALMLPAADGGERFLAETHAVSYLTGFTEHELKSAGGPGLRPMLALGNPDQTLPGAAHEVEALRAIRPDVTVLVGAAATKGDFTRLAREHPHLHLATHGVLDRRRPRESYLVVAGREGLDRLTITDIRSLELVDATAILSACETAVGEDKPGAALITLAGAFTEAGSQSVVASLWKVEDTATRDFMLALHGTLPREGLVAAVHRAQRALIAREETAHPFYWAAFVLIGRR